MTFTRIDNITDEILKHYQASYGRTVTKDDIFYFVYGLLHSPDYRAIFASDLKKMLPASRSSPTPPTSLRLL